MIARKIAPALAFARHIVTDIAHRADGVALAGYTLRKVKVPVRTAFTIVAREIAFARTSAAIRLTVIAVRARQIAFALFTVRESVVSIRARVTVGRLELGPTLALARLLRAIARQIEIVTVAGLAHVDLVPGVAVWPVKCGPALVAVDALRIMLTILADTASLVLAMNVQ